MGTWNDTSDGGNNAAESFRGSTDRNSPDVLTVEFVKMIRCNCGADVIEYIDHDQRCWKTFHGSREAILVVTLDQIIKSIETGDQNIEGMYDRWIAEVHRYENGESEKR